MASSTLRSGTEAETGAGELPIDAIYEILIRLPAEELCRLRVVCRPWRFLLSDPQFIATHAAHHQRLLFVAGQGKCYRCDAILCRIIDLSGRAIKQFLPASKGEWLLFTQGNLACVVEEMDRHWQLLNLDTGDRFSMPQGFSREHTPRKPVFVSYKFSIAVGQVASTGELKLLRVIDNVSRHHIIEQLCDVLTLGGSRDARWRGKKAAQDRVATSPLSRVAIDGVVYFVLDENLINQDVPPKGIASFDLLTEEWRSILRGPVSTHGNLSLAALNGSLVLVHCSPYVSLDLWFLMDFEKGLWVKQHTVEIISLGGLHVNFFVAHPLVILKNGIIAIFIKSNRGLLTIYDPRTNTYTDVAEMGSTKFGIGMYTGNLLCLTNDAI